jgi:hypothetical protein
MTMEHAEAIDTGAAERYALGEMNENERDQYEEHFFDCPECASEVKAVTVFLENADAVVREDDPPAEEEDLQRLAAWPVHRAVPAPAPRFAGWKARFWPMPLGAAAAAVLLLGVAVYQSLVVLPTLRLELNQAHSLQSAPAYFLSISRSEMPVVTASGHERMVVLILSRTSDRQFTFYRCELRDAGGRTVLSSVVPAPPARDELQVLLPVDSLLPGPYVLAVAGLESGSASAQAEPTHYNFRLQRGTGSERR